MVWCAEFPPSSYGNREAVLDAAAPNQSKNVTIDVGATAKGVVAWQIGSVAHNRSTRQRHAWEGPRPSRSPQDQAGSAREGGRPHPAASHPPWIEEGRLHRGGNSLARRQIEQERMREGGHPHPANAHPPQIELPSSQT
jgi:hypothetical protein